MGAIDEFNKRLGIRLLEIEQMYDIDILLWSLRGSADIGIFRKNSDLDIIIVFDSKNNDIRAFHDILGHGFDLWGWSIEDVKKTIIMNLPPVDKISYISKDYERASLSPYFGFFCSMNNDNSEIMKNSIHIDNLYSLYAPEMIVLELFERLYEITIKINRSVQLSGYEYLYGCWYAFMCRHIINGGMPGENKLSDIISYASNTKVLDEINYIRKKYYNTNGKNSCIVFNSVSLNDELMRQYEYIQYYLSSI